MANHLGKWWVAKDSIIGEFNEMVNKVILYDCFILLLSIPTILLLHFQLYSHNQANSIS